MFLVRRVDMVINVMVGTYFPMAIRSYGISSMNLLA